MKKLLITSSIIALTALASCSQVVSPNTKDNDITGLEATYQVTCGDKFEEQGKKVASTSEDVKFAFYTDEQLTERYYDIKYDGLVGSINGGTSADYWVKVTAGGGATGYKEVSKIAKITATCVQSDIGIVSTDCIGEKAFACKYCGAKMSSGSLMDDDDVVLYDGNNFNYGITPGVIYTAKSDEPFLDGDITYELPTRGSNADPKQINLPRINFEIYADKDILLKFRTNNAPDYGSGFEVTLGTNEEADNLFNGLNETRWGGSAGPDMTGYFLLNYNSTSKELTITNTIESDKVVTINDSDIIKGNKSIALYGYGKYRTFALFEKCIELNHIHSWKAEETAPTDKIGFKVHECSVCKKHEYSDNLMEGKDIVLYDGNNFNYGITSGVIYTAKSDEPFLDGDISYSLEENDGQSSPKQINLPRINFEIYADKDILLKFRTNNAPDYGSGFEVTLGTNEEADNLFNGLNETRWGGSAGPDMTGYFLLNYNSTSKELTITNTIESDKVVTINDSDIIKGNKSIALYGYGKYRTFALFEKCIELNHIHSWKAEETAPTDKIGFKVHECSVCKKHEYSTNLMQDSDIKIDSTSSYGANANMYYESSQSASSEGVWGMTWRYDTAGEYEMLFPKVMYEEYSTVTFNFTTNEATWSGGQVALGTTTGQYDLISDQLHRQALSGKITATYDVTAETLTLIALDVTAQNGETQLGTATIPVDDNVASGSENLKLYLKLGPSRGLGITSVNVVTE